MDGAKRRIAAFVRWSLLTIGLFWLIAALIIAFSQGNDPDKSDALVGACLLAALLLIPSIILFWRHRAYQQRQRAIEFAIEFPRFTVIEASEALDLSPRAAERVLNGLANRQILGLRYRYGDAHYTTDAYKARSAIGNCQNCASSVWDHNETGVPVCGHCGLKR